MRRMNLSKGLHGLSILIGVICLLPVFPLVAEGQSIASLAGTWNYSGFATGPSSPWWGRGTATVASDGTFTFSGTESNGKADSGSGVFSITSSGIVMTVNGQSDSYLCQLNSDITFMVCAETWPDGSSNLVILTNQAASCSLADLAGNWDGNILSSGPTPGWTRVSETINQDGTFTGTSTSSDGSSGSLAGTLSISSDGVITCVSGSCVDPTYMSSLDAGKTITVGTSGAATTTEDANLFVFTKQAASYSVADLAGTWQGNGLVSGPGAPWWENDTLTINSDGTCSFYWTGSDGASGSGSGTVTVSSSGVITVAPGTVSSTTTGVIDANMAVMVFTDTLPDGATQEIKIFTYNALVAPSVAPIISPSAGDVPTTTGDATTAGSSTAPPANDSPPSNSSTANSYPGGAAPQVEGSPTAQPGPTDGTASTSVTATNAIETSPASSPSNSVKPAKVPDAPTDVTATVANGQATVSFKLPANAGGQITGCTVTSNPGGISATGLGSPITVSNLTKGTAYTFTVTAINKIGTSPASSPSNSVTPATVPDAPTTVAAKADKAEAKVSFKAPASNGGIHITSYTVTSSAGQTSSGPASPITVKGLTKGTAYTFTVTATNKIGTGPASSPSNSVTPATVPDAPTSVAAKAGKAEAKVSFKAPASNGGIHITSYTVTSSAGQTGSGPASPITVKGLTKGTAYTFTVTATNAIGTGPPSSASNSVMPR